MAKLIKDTSLRIQNLSAVEVERIEPLDILGLLRAVWHGKWVILFTTMLAVLMAGYYAFAVAGPQFSATATLRVEAEAGPMVDVASAVAGLSADPASINTEVAILQSDHLLGQVIVTLGLTDDPEFNRYLTPIPALSVTGLRTRLRNTLTGQSERAPTPDEIFAKTVDNLRGAVSASVQRDTYIFRITVTTGSDEKSALIANTLAAVYLADQVAAKHGATEAAVTWLSDRVFQLQLDLEAKETAINELITTSRVQDGTVLDALSRQAIETGQRLAEARRALLTAQASVISASGQRDGDVQRLTSQVAALEVFQASLTNQLADQSAGLVRLQQLRREADATRVIYETFLARLQETQIQRGLQNPNSRVLSPATTGRYVAPRKMLILAIGALLGGLVGLGWVLGRHALQTGFNDAQSLADRFDLPVMGQIPRMPLRRRGQLLDYLTAKPASAAAEAVRNMRTSLLLAKPDAVPQVILSTSTIAGEGKTTQSIALAHDLSRLGRSVLLIDADARQSAFAAYFDTHGAARLDQVVSGETPIGQAVMRDPRILADILCAAKVSQNPADFYFGAPFKAFLEDMRSRYDHVILDAPPVLPVPDARLLARQADAVLYAVGWRKTPAPLVEAGIDTLASLHVPITGLVLSRIDPRRARQTGGAYFADYGQPYHQN